MEESITIIQLIVNAVNKADLKKIFDKDSYESRRKELKGPRLVILMVIFQLIKSPYMRGLVRVITDNKKLQELAGGEIARSTLSNALAKRPVEQVMEAWQELIKVYGQQLERVGKKFARLGLIDASLIKLSLEAYDWAEYRKKKGAAKLHMVLDWGLRIPQQLVMTVGKVHDASKKVKISWQRGWTYVQDRGYLCFTRLKSILAAGAHFVVRFKKGVNFQVIERREVDTHKQANGIRLLSDWTVKLEGWPDTLLRMVSYQLPDRTTIRVLTDRFDLTAENVAQLYKERWKIENWWKWVKQVFKIKEPIARNENGFQIQIITALIADLILRVFKKVGKFSGSIYEFVVSCQELSLVVSSDLAKGLMSRAFELIYLFITSFSAVHQSTRAS